jgi:hypothetical protein
LVQRSHSVPAFFRPRTVFAKPFAEGHHCCTSAGMELGTKLSMCSRGLLLPALVAALNFCSESASLVPDAGNNGPEILPVTGADGGVDADMRDVADKPFAANPRFLGMAPGDLLDLGAYLCNDPADWKSGYPCATVTDYSGFTYDAKRHRMVMFGGGHAATARTDIRALDLSGALTWESDYPSTPWSEMTRANADLTKSIWVSTGHPIQHHTYDQLVYVPTTDRLLDMTPQTGRILYSTGYPADMPPESISTDVFEYDANTKHWQTFSAPPRWAPYGATSFDPPSGLVLAFGVNGLWSWDPVRHLAAKVLPLGDPAISYGQNMVYMPSIDAHLYVRADGIVFRVDFNRAKPADSRVSRVTTSGAAPAMRVDTLPDASETGWAVDSKRNRVCGGLLAGVFYCLDAATFTWTAHPLGGSKPPQRFAFHTVQLDPINDVYIFLSLDERHTYAWRPTN